MSDETKPDQLPTTEDETVTPLDVAADLLLDSTIPAPIRKGALKAFGQLCTALIDVPLGGLRRRDAEKWAETEARIKIIGENADQIAQKMKVPLEYAQRAVKKYGEKILREQSNLDKICAIAVNLLKKEKSASSIDQSADHSEERAIKDDWLNGFEEEARQKSTEDMQLLFARILAGEISQPGSYSIRAVKTLSQLDQNVAFLFKKLCSMCVALRDPFHKFVIDARVCSLGGDANANALRGYGLIFHELNILNEYGLIISEYHSSHSYYDPIQNKNTQRCFPFWYQGRYWGLCPLPGWKEENRHEFRLWGVALSQTGRELLRVVDLEPVDDILKVLRPRYTEGLKEFFGEHNLRMAEVQVRQESFGEHKMTHFYVQ